MSQICEDAPCCGCCGHQAWAMEDYFEPEFDEFDYPEEDDDDED